MTQLPDTNIGWKPIDTAPKSGEWILGKYYSGRVAQMRWEPPGKWVSAIFKIWDTPDLWKPMTTSRLFDVDEVTKAVLDAAGVPYVN